MRRTLKTLRLSYSFILQIFGPKLDNKLTTTIHLEKLKKKDGKILKIPNNYGTLTMPVKMYYLFLNICTVYPLLWVKNIQLSKKYSK